MSDVASELPFTEKDLKGMTTSAEEKLNPGDSLGTRVAMQLMVEVPVPECDIVSSDAYEFALALHSQRLAEHADDKEHSNSVHTKTLKWENQISDVFSERETTFSFIAPTSALKSGRPVTFALGQTTEESPKGKYAGPLTLFAVVRDDIAFPLAYFRRSPENEEKKWCDHVQFPGEDTMSELESVEHFTGGVATKTAADLILLCLRLSH